MWRFCYGIQVRCAEDGKGESTILIPGMKYSIISDLGEVFPDVARLMRCIYFRKLINNQETEFAGSLGTTDCQLSDPA